jgi:hypothetical protein
MLSVYNKLFTVKVKHDFYKDLVSRDDILFMPTKECRAFMESNRLLFRRAEDGSASLLYRTDGAEGSTEPFIPIDPNKYVFALGLKDKARFLNITNLEYGTAQEQYTSGKLAYFRNTSGQSSLDYELIDLLRPSLFTYEFMFSVPAPAQNTGHLVVRDEDNAVVIDETGIAREGSGYYKIPVDFRSLLKGKYTFNYSDATNPAVSETVYIDNDLAGRDIFGVLVIDSSMEQDLSDFLALSPFEMVFTRQETLWRYIIVLKTGKVLPSDTLEIADILYDDTGSSYAEYTFVTDGQTTVNGFEARKFISVETIPFFEEPKMDLKLKKTSGAITTTIIEDLPNPLSHGVIAGYATTEDLPVSEVFIYV